MVVQLFAQLPPAAEDNYTGREVEQTRAPPARILYSTETEITV